MKKLLLATLFMSFILAFSLINIYKATPLEETELTPDKIISVIAKSQAPFFQAVKSGVEKAANDYGVQVNFEAPVSEVPEGVVTQLKLLETAISKNPQSIALDAIDSKAVTPYLEQAQSMGIPVIGFDSGVDSPIVKTTVETDNYGAGELAANKMAELIGESGKVGIIVPNLTGRSIINRTDGFINTIRENYPNIEVLPVLDSQGSLDKAILFSKELIAKNPDIKGIFTANEGTTEGLVLAIQALNKVNQVKIIGFDSGRIILNAIREGVISGAITQDPVSIGYRTIGATIKASEGERLPAFIYTSFAWYDKSNIDSPEIQSMLYK